MTERFTQMRLVARYSTAVILMTAVVLLAVTGCGGDNGEGNGTSSNPESEAGEPNESTTAAGITSERWVAVTLVDGSTLFGQESELSDDGNILALSSTYFIAEGSQDVNTLRRFGNEIHSPYSLTAIPWISVRYQQPLSVDSPALSAIGNFQVSNPETSTPDALLPPDSYQAVFLRSGEVYFGKLESEPGVYVLRSAHYLQFKDDQAASAQQITSLDEVVLVPQERTIAGPTGDMWIPQTSLLYFQTLKEDSPVVEALRE